MFQPRQHRAYCAVWLLIHKKLFHRTVYNLNSTETNKTSNKIIVNEQWFFFLYNMYNVNR